MVCLLKVILCLAGLYSRNAPAAEHLQVRARLLVALLSLKPLLFDCMT
jgi:hypothetical protein